MRACRSELFDSFVALQYAQDEILGNRREILDVHDFLDRRQPIFTRSALHTFTLIAEFQSLSECQAI